MVLGRISTASSSHVAKPRIKWSPQVRINMLNRLFATFLLVAFAGVGASASTTYQLTTDLCGGGCNPGAPGSSMGTVTVNGIGTTALTITIALIDPLLFVNTGLQQTIDFELAGMPTLSDFTVNNANFSLDSTTAGSEHLDGLGFFEYALKLNKPQGGGGAVPGPVTFSFTCSTNCNPIANATGYVFGVDVFSNNLNGATGNGNTGAIGATTGSTVPEASTMILLAAGLMGIGGFRRFRTKLAK